MRFLALAIYFFTSLFFYSGLVTAAPQVGLETTVKKSGREILITLHQGDMDSMIAMDCHYNVFAADKKRDLKALPGKGLSIATFFRAESPLSIIAVQLKRLSLKKIGKKRTRLYLRVLIPCKTGETFLSEVVKVPLRSSKRGTVHSIDRLLKRMKNHMRYATEQD